MRRTVLSLVLMFLVLGICSPNPGLGQETPSQNTVIVMGMIHGNHRTSESYGLEQVKAIITKIDPDFVLTEIPPDRLEAAARQFAESGKITESRVRVFPEYTDALFPLTTELDFQIIPCAAWTTEMNDSRRATMAKLRTTHAEQYAEMQQAQQTASENIAKLGSSNDPAIIHTDEYDEFVRAGMEPYDRHFNDLIGAGGWTNINAAHYALIDEALDKHSGAGKTFLITFGSWHKYYIKEQLRKRKDIKLVSLQNYLGNSETDKKVNWNQFRMTANRHGALGTTEIKQPKLAWAFDTGEIIESSPTVYGDTIYVGGHSKRMHALDQATGEKKWVFDTAGWVRASPSVVDGVVFFGSDDNTFYALDAKTGEKIWDFPLGDGGEQSSPAIADGTVYFGAFDHFVYALDAGTGAQKWKFDAGASMLSSPALNQQAVFIATYAGELFAIDRKTGKQLWKFHQNDKPIFSSPALSDDVLFFTSYDHHVYAVEAATGETKWKFKTGHEIFSSPAVAAGVVYVGSNDNYLYALDEATGQQVWKTDLHGAVFASPTVSGSTIYVGSSDGYLYAIDKKTGEQIWRYLVQEGVNVWSSAAAVDGKIYFGSHAGQVIALEEK